ncbi:hypothetical protein CYY_004979 [Polysphondylium violaceum]|uniref:Uncharacterized protein n=1 Tax=Polysphondylium violaceum TaxID=133409 RepID=A0A8J4PUB5_9MYCE|nr:hypothetical protein CYY_004979 [Polysphondylium violaceum]
MTSQTNKRANTTTVAAPTSDNNREDSINKLIKHDKKEPLSKRLEKEILFLFCVSAGFVSLIVKDKKDPTPFKNYGFISVLLVASTFLSNHSIRYISYPTQVLTKSCKPIPVLIMGILFFKRHYSLAKYFIVVVISLGVCLFMFPGASSKNNIHNEGSDHFFGNMILLISLLMDGVMGPFQDNLVSKYKPSSTQMMLSTNIWNFFLFLIVTILHGELFPAIEYIQKYPDIIPYILAFCITSAVGQQFIFLTTNKFGSLNCSTITTTRKFFSILVSIFWFGHSLNQLQWFSIGLVFSGLGLDVFQSYKKKPKLE